ncbi:DNA-directed RNA polymerase subunit E'' [Candidatus Bathyarchaeota archaeon]|nr:DNA-directed RNA polymerase subunit E'' [Candidatus Bathyarchaeota archaeon]NIU80738.1 DNA-directed RNA polymerase subunit E'' [Candidatus Bathyarchaeota archaeon]NIV67365.1 DNA-directed RNA polymerase subunit E'' [Candidatus Bathyarchaeota archaeon]
MTEKACRECQLISEGSTCPKCKTASLSEDYSGLVIIFDAEDSAIAEAMETERKGRYALRVR